MINLAKLERHTRSLVWNADDGLLLWEVSRRTPEGITAGICRTERGKEIMEQYGRTLDDLDRPVLATRPKTDENFLSAESFKQVLEDFSKKDIVFDRIFFRDPFTTQDSADVLAYSLSEIAKIGGLLPENFQIVISQRIPRNGQRIGDLILNQVLLHANVEENFDLMMKKMSLAENEFFGDTENPLFAWDAKSISESFKKYNFDVKNASKIVEEKRRITNAEISKWFDPKTSSYGSALYNALGGEDLEKIKNLLSVSAQKNLFSWKTEIEFLTVCMIK